MRMSAGHLRDLSLSSDDQITALACAGNRDAFGELIQRNYRKSSQIAFKIVGNPVVVEDLLSECAYKAYVHLDQLVGGQFAPWFNRIVVNECYQYLRVKRRTRQVVPADDMKFDVVATIASPELNPEAQAGSSELAALLAKEISRLPQELKVPLLLSLRRRSILEIGQELGISVPAAKSRLFRARNHLRRRASRYLPLVAHRTAPVMAR